MVDWLLWWLLWWGKYFNLAFVRSHLLVFFNLCILHKKQDFHLFLSAEWGVILSVWVLAFDIIFAMTSGSLYLPPSLNDIDLAMLQLILSQCVMSKVAKQAPNKKWIYSKSVAWLVSYLELTLIFQFIFYDKKDRKINNFMLFLTVLVKAS